MEYGHQLEFNMAVSYLESLSKSMCLISYYQQTKNVVEWEHELRNLLNKIVDFTIKESDEFDEMLMRVRKKVRSLEKVRSFARETVLEKSIVELETIQRKMYRRMHHYNIIKPKKVDIGAHEKLKRQWGLKYNATND